MICADRSSNAIYFVSPRGFTSAQAFYPRACSPESPR